VEVEAGKKKERRWFPAKPNRALNEMIPRLPTASEWDNDHSLGQWCPFKVFLHNPPKQLQPFVPPISREFLLRW